jgi:hypothetical protein
MSDYFHTSSGTIVPPPREWCKVGPTSDIQMQGFKKLSEVDPSIAEPKFDEEIPLISKIDESGCVIDMGEEEEPKGY